MTGTLHEDKFTFFIISRSVLLRMRNISDRHCIENQNTPFLIDSVLVKNRAFYEIMWKNTVHPGKSQKTIRLLRITCWIPKSTNAHSEYCCSTETMISRTRLRCYIHGGNNADRTYLRWCPARAWNRLRCLQGVREGFWLFSVTFEDFHTESLLIISSYTQVKETN